MLGREPVASVWIDSSCISRRHARIVVSATGVSIEDLGSRNGTLLNGALVRGVQPLSDRDEVDLGPERLVVRIRGAAEATETQRR